MKAFVRPASSPMKGKSDVIVTQELVARELARLRMERVKLENRVMGERRQPLRMRRMKHGRA